MYKCIYVLLLPPAYVSFDGHKGRTGLQMVIHEKRSFAANMEQFTDIVVWDAATCGGTLNNKHDEPTSFFSSSLKKLLTSDFLVRHPQLGGGVAATEPAAEGQEGEAGEKE